MLRAMSTPNELDRRLLLAGGLKAMQIAAIVAALPFAAVILLLCVSLHRAVRNEHRDRARAERELRRRLREARTAPEEPVRR